jgi:hypothetical protein
MNARKASVALAIGAVAVAAVLTVAVGGAEQAYANNYFGGAGSTTLPQKPPSTPPIPSASPTLKAQPWLGGQGNGKG